MCPGEELMLLIENEVWIYAELTVISSTYAVNKYMTNLRLKKVL